MCLFSICWFGWVSSFLARSVYAFFLHWYIIKSSRDLAFDWFSDTYRLGL
jgi:hypothetical protein